MNILVLYASSEGQTRKIAEYAAECLRERNHDVVLADAAAKSNQPDLSGFDTALLASRVHAGRHHRAIIAFAKRHHQLLAAMDTAFLSVSMSAALKGPRDSEKLAQYRGGFIRAAGWEPGRYHDVAGARLYAQHNRLTRWILGLVDGHQFDTSKDHEFTDWLDLRTFVDDWATGLGGRGILDLPFWRPDHQTPQGRKQPPGSAPIFSTAKSGSRTSLSLPVAVSWYSTITARAMLPTQAQGIIGLLSKAIGAAVLRLAALVWLGFRKQDYA